MKTQIKLLLLACSLALFSYDLPKGWFKAGSDPDKYDMGTDKGAGIDGKNVATIRSLNKRINGFGTLMQTSLAEKYWGKRVRMSGFMRSQNVKSWAAFWFRVDSSFNGSSLGFDNMNHRAIKGTTDWKRYELVLDVPANASNLAYGALLAGTGQIWFDNINFEIVDNTVPVTNIKTGMYNGALKEPQNLNFED